MISPLTENTTEKSFRSPTWKAFLSQIHAVVTCCSLVSSPLCTVGADVSQLLTWHVSVLMWRPGGAPSGCLITCISSAPTHISHLKLVLLPAWCRGTTGSIMYHMDSTRGNWPLCFQVGKSNALMMAEIMFLFNELLLVSSLLKQKLGDWLPSTGTLQLQSPIKAYGSII